MIVSIVTNPYLVTMLITLGLIGVGLEFFSPGFGVPGIIGLGAFALYFFGTYMAGSSGWGTLALFVAGGILLILEIFVLAFGVLGILGFSAMVGAIISAASSVWMGVVSLAIGIVLAALILWLAIRLFGLKPSWNKLILQSSQKNEQGYTSSEDRRELLGKIGVTITPLRPSGFAEFDGQREDVVSEGDIVPHGAKVKVIRVEGARVVVRKVEDQ
ncbi:nodulation protein NfeD [Paenactinomyces guangxiensis]|nr:NfeD family protein [Paenactinomyces guangxiensis]